MVLNSDGFFLALKICIYFKVFNMDTAATTI